MGLGWDPGQEQGGDSPLGLAPPLPKVEATWRDTSGRGGSATSQEGGEAEQDAPSSPPFSQLVPTSHRLPKNEKWGRRR